MLFYISQNHEASYKVNQNYKADTFAHEKCKVLWLGDKTKYNICLKELKLITSFWFCGLALVGTI